MVELPDAARQLLESIIDDIVDQESKLTNNIGDVIIEDKKYTKPKESRLLSQKIPSEDTKIKSQLNLSIPASNLGESRLIEIDDCNSYNTDELVDGILHNNTLRDNSHKTKDSLVDSSHLIGQQQTSEFIPSVENKDETLQICNPPCNQTATIQTENESMKRSSKNHVDDKKTASFKAECATNNKDDNKLTMYKALAIKLKKELVKTRNELKSLENSSDAELISLRSKVEILEKSLHEEKTVSKANKESYESTLTDLKERLSTSESSLKSLKSNYDTYKEKAMADIFKDDLFVKLRSVNKEQNQNIVELTQSYADSASLASKLEKSNRGLQSQVNLLKAELQKYKDISLKCKKLSKENENLLVMLDEYRKISGNNVSKERPEIDEESTSGCGINQIVNTSAPQIHSNSLSIDKSSLKDDNPQQLNRVAFDDLEDKSKLILDNPNETLSEKLVPANIRDILTSHNSQQSTDSLTNCSLATPIAFAGKYSALFNAQKQIDELTKAYMQSESTNMLLKDQVQVLKEEIRRIQLGNERLEIVDRLEYLKNIILKFILLDSSQKEQKQRLVPVLTTVLKLSPDEIVKLNDIVQKGTDKSVAQSFFKFPLI